MTNDTSYIIPTLNDLIKLEYHIGASGFSLLPKQPVNSVLSGKHTSKLRGRGLDFEEVREYVPGDDIRNIDWRVTARVKSTHTKVFTEEKEKPVVIVTDMCTGMYFGSEKYTKLLLACQMASISAFKTLKNSDRFGGLIMCDDKIMTYRPQRSRVATLQYLQGLVDRANKLHAHPPRIKNKEKIFQECMKRLSAMATHDHVILIISDFYDTTPDIHKSIMQLSKHNDIILTQITDPLERQLPESDLVISNGPLQLLWNAIGKKNRRKFETKQEEAQLTFCQQMKKYGIPIIDLDTTTDIETQLKELFKSKLQPAK